MVSLSAPIGHPETRALLCTSVQRGGRNVRYERFQERCKLHRVALSERVGRHRPAMHGNAVEPKDGASGFSRTRIGADPPCTCT
jgi:hypothetical protein